MVVDSQLPAAFLLAELLFFLLLLDYFSSDPANLAKLLPQLVGLFLLAMIVVLLAQILICLRKISDRATPD